MAVEDPHDLLIECANCSVENIFSDYTPEMVTICNQCRGRLILSDFNQTHNEYRCDDCGFVLCLSKDTPFEKGKTACRCQSFNIRKIGKSTLYEETEEAGTFEEKDRDDDVVEPDEDWCRSDLSDIETRDDYNEMFDQDPGNN